MMRDWYKEVRNAQIKYIRTSVLNRISGRTHRHILSVIPFSLDTIVVPQLEDASNAKR